MLWQNENNLRLLTISRAIGLFKKCKIKKSVLELVASALLALEGKLVFSGKLLVVGRYEQCSQVCSM